MKQLGFKVVRMAEDWTEAEVKLIVADYFNMLRAELLSQPYNKTSHRERLAPKLIARSNGSIEFKHQNISAVLVTLGLPYINGYKPRGNFQELLSTAVEDHTARNPGFFDQLWLTSTGADRTIRVWDATNGKELKTLHGHTANVYSVAWSPIAARWRRRVTTVQFESGTRWAARKSECARVTKRHYAPSSGDPMESGSQAVPRTGH